MTPTELPFPVRARRVNGVTLETAESGPSEGPLVILLHGFPDCWESWHSQLTALSEAGYRVLAPNQRGYAGSDQPTSLAAYDLDLLAQDVVALAESEGRTEFRLVGHDWGGIVAWWVAARFPERVAHLSVLNAPHPGIFRSYLLRHPTQLLRSWYVGVFQFPWLPEFMLRLRIYGLLYQAVRSTGRPGTFDESDRRVLVRSWKAAGSLSGMLNYYRAILRRPESSLRRRISVSTIILFGRNDPAEEPGLAMASLELCDRGRIVWFEDGWHWIQREESAAVNRELLEFFSEP